MNEDLRSACGGILDKLCENATISMFLQPVDPIADGVSDYFDVIQNPSDISTVRSKLDAGVYKTFADFKKDVNQIWENAALYNGRPSLPSFIADELSHQFQKLCKPYDELTTEEWISQYLKARADLQKIFRYSPKCLEPADLTVEPDILVPEKKAQRSRLTTEDARIFSEVMTPVEDPVHLQHLLQIISDNEPSIDLTEETVKLNLTTLSQKTIRLLKNWVLEVKGQNGLHQNF